ncbi:hypothetical protein [Lacticaseibacillus absianus]|uniref:hypothetical protein n=1 Tax=Lacticaseibacillus absianus TaxID=2729623 RepID=UPI0015C73B1E|nr:hypothetical protein [Lacticaseibacillus absianus]
MNIAVRHTFRLLERAAIISLALAGGVMLGTNKFTRADSLEKSQVIKGEFDVFATNGHWNDPAEVPTNSKHPIIDRLAN